MFCKRITSQAKRAKAELEEIRVQQQAIVESLIGNYRTVLRNIDAARHVTCVRCVLQAAIMVSPGPSDLKGR